MKKLIFLFTIFAFSQQMFAQCNETNVQKVMLVGDSWAFFMGVDQTINTVFDRWGHSNYTFYTNAVLSENGAETVDFMQADKQNEIQAQLDARPEIEAVHLSLGGNDVLGDWNVNFTQFQTDSLMDTVFTRLISIIDFIKDARPGIQIFWSGYAYPNFGEVLFDAGFLQTVHPFYDTWESMGFPDFAQLNGLLNEYSSIMEAYAQADPQVDFINATGLMQYTFGQNTAISIDPGGSYPPLTAPLPAGFEDYPSPKNSMRDYGLFLDCFHLSAGGYRDFFGYHTQKFYHKFLMDDEYFLASNSDATGSVTAAGTAITDTLWLGTDSITEYRPVITFNTSTLPDAGAASASIFIRREMLEGNNPVNDQLSVLIRSGLSPETAAVIPETFDAAADISVIPCVFGDNNGNNRWIRLDLPESALPFINNSGLVQFVLATSDTLGGKSRFSGAGDTDFAPVLNVTHQLVTSIEPIEITRSSEILVFPNPAKDHVFFKSDQDKIEQVELFNQQGQLIKVSRGNNQLMRFDLSGLAKGLYIARTRTAHGTTSQRLIVQ